MILFKLYKILILVWLLHCSVVLFAQQTEASADVNFSIPEVALIDIEPEANNSISFQVDQMLESGEAPAIHEVAGKSLWLNYTSSTVGKQTRSVLATISAGEIPDGLSLFVEAGNYTGIGKGKTGRANAKKKLSSTKSQKIIKKIGNCFTGTGEGNGHLLTFSISISNYSKIQSTSGANFIVLYTLTDN